MARQPVPLTIPPGIVTTPTRKSNSSNWRDGHLLRWRDGKLTPICGWTRRSYTPFASPVRAIHRWTTNLGISMVAYLCEEHVYVDQGDGVLTDISPVVPLTPPSLSSAGGYGDNLYGAFNYGDARPDREITNRRVTPGFAVDNWGQNLVAMTSADGRLLMWDPSSPPGTKMEAVAGAPTGNRTFLVMPQRHVILFGAGGFTSRWAWCDEEDIENWNFADVASKAGFLESEPASPIIAASRSGNDAVYFTEAGNAHYIEYVGMPAIFGGDKFASGCTPFPPASIADTPRGAVWISEGGFWSYQSRAAIGIDCDVWNWATGQLDNDATRSAAAMAVVPSETEIWWFFSTGALGLKNDRCVIWNYTENWWSQGYLTRSAGCNATYTGFPIMSDGENIYDHETGLSYPGADKPWAGSFPFTLDIGASMVTIPCFTPDFDGQINSISFELDYNIARSSDTPDVRTGEKSILSDGNVYFGDPSPTGRDFRMTIRQVVDNVEPWTVGNNLLYVVPRGPTT
jgi:hypothetical protein